MSELAIVAIVLMAISILISAVVRIYNQRVAAVAGPHRWEIREEAIAVNGPTKALEAGVRISLYNGHGVPIIVGVAHCSAVDFEEQLIDLRVKAEDKATILNRGLNA